MSLIQVVPRLPPPLEGVGSYALALASDLELDCRFVVGDPGWPGGGTAARFEAIAVTERTGRWLARLLGKRETTVLLHYVNYGYHPRGCPAWLVRGLELWRREAPAGRLLTLFHEVWATGPPWRSSFWLWPVQRKLAGQLAWLSDAAVTSLPLYARRIAGLRRDLPVEVIPVFSTVGEPEALPALNARSRRLVLFGGRSARQRAYGELRASLEGACCQLEIEEIQDIGLPVGAPAKVAGRPLLRLGPLPAAEVSAVLLEALAGFVAYPAAFLPKSTIFAAYAAHRVLPVVAGAAGSADDPVRSGEHYWPASWPAPPSDPEAIAEAAHRWYLGHRLDHHVRIFRELLAQ